MPRQAKVLSERAVAALRSPGLYFVGGVQGLALQVAPSGARSWILRATISGRRRDMGLGPCSEVSLSEARDAALDARRAIRAGGDPIGDRKRAATARREELLASVSFKKAALDYIAANEASWRNPKHRQQWATA